MNRRLSGVLGVVAALACADCGGYGLLQTARTQARGTTSIGFGAGVISNAERKATANTATAAALAEIGFRHGLTDRIDLGIGAYLLGAGLSAKMNVLPLRSPAALAPRLGVGVGAGGSIDSVTMAQAGLLASYDFAPSIAVYAGATFFNHWIRSKRPSWAELQPGEQYAARNNLGDGIVQLGGGLRLGSEQSGAVFVEYDRWIPAQNDPGDYYKFQACNLFLLGMRLCVSSGCKGDGEGGKLRRVKDLRGNER